MKSILCVIFIFLLVPEMVQGQVGSSKELIKPYLQDATPTSIIIKWETSAGDESTVEWGITRELGRTSDGINYDINFGPSRIHEVKLEGLERFTSYFYRVRTDSYTSEIFQFKTPPFSSDHTSFSLIAMSDMQFDHNRPDKFKEIIDDGILPYFQKQSTKGIHENVAMVLVPGDLVKDGDVYFQWKEHFFNPAERLFAQVPLYPVLGNHERNSNFYFKYFSLPENGTPAYAEHWWYKDYGNTRIIGLNSNDGFRDLSSQLEWLQKLLNETSENEEIDFVFAQLHHPHKSELWIPGETKFSGKVVEELEKFTTKSGKPSIHFFGHTHGYSRGQSRDHKHLWINVASAGGAIDNWGEFEGRDYDEFTVTQDEYGFVEVVVEADPVDPKFTIKRISRGNDGHFRDNEITDELTVWKKERKPDAPLIKVTDSNLVSRKGVLLKAGRFMSSFDGATHAASQWQIAVEAEFKKPIFDSWKQSENWYYLENRQKDDNLTDEWSGRLIASTKYFWRVRYRDQNLNWSEWSDVQNLLTGK